MNDMRVSIQSKTIPLAPFGKARSRVTRNGTYMPADYVKAKHDLAMLFGAVEVEGSVGVKIIATIAMPQSWSKKRKGDMDGRHSDSKPDVDNLAGSVLDALFPDDDKRVVSLFCRKVWGYEGSMEITIAGVV